MNKTSFTVVDKVILYRLFEAIGIPTRVGSPIIVAIHEWVKKNGPEWTVDRLKNLKTLYLQHYGGNKAFRLDATARIAVHSDGSPKGCFHALWTMGSSHRTVNKAFSVLMVYSSFIWTGKPLASQLKKFLTAVENPRAASLLPAWELDEDFCVHYWKCWAKAEHSTMARWTTSTKKVLSFDPIKGLRKVVESSIPVDAHFTDFLILCHSIIDQDLARFLVKYTGSFQMFHRKKFLDQVRYIGPDAVSLRDFCESHPIVGSIGFIQERGLKLRVVANPLRTIQYVLSKLENMLKRAVKKFPWDCTFDQEKGIRWAQTQLSLGKRLYCFDLSNASDTIPLEDQILFLKHVGPKNDSEYDALIRLYEKVSRGFWLFRCEGQPIRLLKWTKGQALGVVCSFGTFSQVHGARLLQLSLSRRIIDSFVVLGDDVIVVEELADLYEDFVVNVWGCDISKPKTLTSDTIAEFASKVTTADRKVAAFKYPKTVRLFSTREPLSLLEKFGKNALRLVPSRFRAQVQLMTTLPKPQGLGWKWCETELVWPDGLKMIEAFPSSREAIVDVAYVEKFRRKGAKYDSVIVREKSLVERKQDLMVAASSLKTEPVIFGKTEVPFEPGALADLAGVPDDNITTSSLSAMEAEYEILHAAQNLENEGFGDYDTWLRQTTKNMPYVSRETSIFEEDPNRNNPTTAFRKKLLLWISTTIGFGAFLSKKYLASHKMTKR